jgi:hypothetical protein
MSCYCEYGEGDTPSFFNEERVRARKQHTCCECLEPILQGEVYERCSGLWDGGFQTFKTCAHCADLRKEAGTGDPWDELPPFGQLACWYAGVIAHEADQMDRETVGIKPI